MALLLRSFVAIVKNVTLSTELYVFVQCSEESGVSNNNGINNVEDLRIDKIEFV